MRTRCGASLLITLVFTVALHSTEPSRAAEVLAKVSPEVRQRTSVPLRFPNKLPFLADAGEVYAVIRSATNSEYIVVLGATPDCRGAHVCSFGALIGTTHPFSDIGFYGGLSTGTKTAVHLQNAITGYFYEQICGAYCSDARIAWTEEPYHYVIGLKGGTKADLIAAANSAIGSAKRK